MNHLICAVGKKMPKWVTTAFDEYHKRLQHSLPFKLIEVEAPKQYKDRSSAERMNIEGEQLLKSIKPNYTVIALDEKGKQHTTIELANQLDHWQQAGTPICFLIGGADGLSSACKNRANHTISLSKLTFPHPMVRVILIEQIYRAWSVQQGHPYHRA